MIVELLRHLFTPCPRPLKRLGVLHDLIALDHRARRQAVAWVAHRQACMQAITQMAEATQTTDPDRPQGGRVVVIGSGLLLEIPLATLAERFAEVVLIDLCHLPTVKRQARAYPGVRLLTHDATGMLDRLESSLASGQLPAPDVFFPQAEGADLVISANCLSQLAGIPLAVADARGGIRPDHCVAWERLIITSHLDALNALATQGVRVGLLCDLRRHHIALGDGAVIDDRDLLAGIPLPPLRDSREWWWDLAPAPEESRRWSVRHRMIAGIL
jgi:hypothetical protein